MLAGDRHEVRMAFRDDLIRLFSRYNHPDGAVRRMRTGLRRAKVRQSQAAPS